MSALSQSLAQDPSLLIPIIAVGGGFIVAIVAIVFTAIKNISINSECEKTRREIAAYVAEGSMTPEDGARLLSASTERKA